MSEWDQILREKWYSQEEPDPIVIQFAKSLRKKSGQARVLDLACGAGRHLVYLAGQGFDACGTDFSATGPAMARERLKRENLKAHIVKCDIKTLPFVDFCFDAVICIRAIYHQRLSEVQQTVSEIHRVLKRNGVLLVNYLSTRTYKYGRGAQIEENTFVEQEGVEKSVVHHFADGRTLRQLFQNFAIIGLRLSEKEVEGNMSSVWVLTATA